MKILISTVAFPVDFRFVSMRNVVRANGQLEPDVNNRV